VTSPNERLKKVREDYGLTQTAFGEQIGLKGTQVRDLESGKVKIDALISKILYHEFYVNPLWLIEGKGNMYVAPKAPQQDSDFTYIPLYDIRAAAGPGALVEKEEVKDFLAFKQDWIRGVLRVNPQDLRLIYVDGDSMEPTLHHGDLILVNVGNHAVVRDGIYVVRFGQAVMVKRLQLLPGDRLKVKSDNESAYEPFIIDLKKLGEEVAVIGRVVWTGRGL